MILDLFMLGLFAGGCFVGWWCRAKFGSASAMIDAGAAKAKSWTGSSKKTDDDL